LARGVTLGELVSQARIAAGRDPNPALSINVNEQLKQAIRQEQERLYDEFDWPFLKITSDKTLEAGSRYYDVPADMNLERISKVDVRYGGRWVPVQRGISLNEYNVVDSDADARMDPVQRWDVRDTGTGEQIEVWPVPASEGIVLRFSGIRKLGPLIANSDIADLDDQMLVGFVAAELLATAKDAAASTKLAKAKSRKDMLQGRVVKTRNNRLSLLGPRDDCERGRRPPLVAYVVRDA